MSGVKYFLALGQGGGIIKYKSILTVFLFLSILLILNLNMVSAADQNQTCSTDQTLNGNQSVEPQTVNQTVQKNPQAAGAQPTFTQAQLNQAASSLNSYVTTNNKMPEYIIIANQQVTISQFLQLLTQNVININSGKTGSMTAVNVNQATAPTENIKSGNIQKSEYLTIAQNIKTFIDNNGRLPNYISTSLGNMRFESAVYLFSKVVDFYNTNQRLPNYVSISKWTGTLQNSSLGSINSSGSNNTGNTTNTGGSTNSSGNTTNSSGSNQSSQITVTQDQLIQAAASIKSFIANNNRLPDYVTIAGKQISIPQFLQLLAQDLSNLNNGKTSALNVCNVTTAPAPEENLKSGNIQKSEYVSLAQSLLNYINANGMLPNTISTSLGNMRFESALYMFSKILDFYNTNQRLPNYVSVSAWSGPGSTGSSLQQYLQPTANCESDSSTIVTLAASLTAGCTSVYDEAAALFNYVRDNVSYSFYYNTVKGALGTLNNKTANCCDHSHLLIALARAVGIPARYVHGTCEFDDGWYGHVWAQLYVNGQWVTADSINTNNTLGVITNWNTSNYQLNGIYAELPF